MNLFERILQDLPCGCIVFEDNGKITFVNPTICELLGYNVDEMIDSGIEVVFTISSRIFYQTHFFPLLKLKGQVSEIFLTLKPKTGPPVPVLVNVKLSEVNGLVSYIGIFTAVWERQKYEEELLLAKKAQQKVLEENDVLIQLKKQLEIHQQELDSKVSMLRERTDEYLQIGKVLTHDMQEPIRKIAFFFEALVEQKEIQQNSENLKKVDIINRSVTRLRFLTNALFDFVNHSSLREEFTHLDVGQLIRKAELDVKQSLGITGFTVFFESIPRFFGDAAQMKRLFIELIKNAVQNRSSHQTLEIQVNAVVIEENIYQANAGKYHYTDHVKLEICDNGIGFERKYESYVFGLLNKLNKKSDGVGLGLTLCKQIVSNHHGSIQIRSNPENGTCVTIVIPVNRISSL
ncbi:PAS domain-containing sensor histidine kinase [Dyadobacter arcticus]|uniref:histidine kinase n=1 Tax=Dyadobacter arcticus TaxID=1078754 RepID=A0ABX0UIC9_9BACT|nr:ATP-binding protein [Dyadobacter arcticus]NIJ52691.1 sigma-B regulation protein RsbU (phosphoserine phosphatase) [Dyadobacter arcticus]